MRYEILCSSRKFDLGLRNDSKNERARDGKEDTRFPFEELRVR
jgi:hypothetical protein